MNGNGDFSPVLSVIFGMNTAFPALSPLIIVAAMLYSYNFVTINLAPLHSPSAGLIFLSKIIIAFTFKVNL